MNPLTAPKFSQLLTTLRQPQWIAAIVSLGVHGALFAAGPSFSSLNATTLGGSNPELEERRVPLIELTPEEQDRLPDFSTSTYSLLPGSNDDLFSLFPPSGDSLPLEPGSDFGASIRIPTPQLPSNSFPSGISPYTSPGRSTIRLSPRRSTLPAIPNNNSLGRRPETPTQGSTSQSASTPTATAPEDANAPGAADLELRQDNNQGNTASSTPSTPLNPSAPNASDDTEQASDLLARVEFSDDQTSTAEVETAKAAWLQSVKAKLGDTVVEAPEPLIIEVPYSGRLCLEPEPADGMLGVVGVPNEADGLSLWTAVLKSTGYPFLNQAAEQALQDLQQADTEESLIAINTLYEVVVEVEYNSEDCISREALLQSRTAEPDQPATPME
ncbi:hypothetical protein IQ273_30300 [Nodosilinea sp. LEGE 07298]|uniref:hypothetical protein n=1 Tax=Nodosilinea sp. LEGE 07298 TaxID=2777970 RepID=UPI00187DE41E|nr:hypothetical protein [Nodosilinea sp. LEGE 07298]MBE9113668.1 hypothetical protein [Nodosilinea sp. LEGE 07298]